MATDEKAKNEPVILKVFSEQSQQLDTRKTLYDKIESHFGKPVVSLFTSFVHSVMLEDSDVDMLAGVLQTMDLSKGLTLFISSPGGDALAAERMINICRTYSKTKTFDTIVPSKAKSAATLVCFGAEKIIMGPTSELGPVDPQIFVKDSEGLHLISIHHIVNSYDELFKNAQSASGNLEPFIQQLSNYKASVVGDYRNQIKLAKSIALRVLKTGMMNGVGDLEIESLIKVFLDPDDKLSHGRPIFADEAANCKLKVESIASETAKWQDVYELYVRLSNYVSNYASKCIENKNHMFTVTIPPHQ